ncbi:MAG: metallophosphoesterase family protein [Pseudomonadota bacterium]
MNPDPQPGIAPAALEFAHLSDPHLSTPQALGLRDWLGKRALGYLSWRRRRRHEHRAEVLEALGADLAADPPEHILITGDLTQLGQPAEFAQGRRWLETLGPPERVGLVPGNHDCTSAEPWAATLEFWAPYLAGDPDAGGAPFPSLRVRAGVAMIGLSSALPTPPLLATGRIGGAQLGRLEQLLTETGRRGLFRVVYLHHSPVPGQDPWRKRLVDAAAVAAVVARTGAELVLHGHRHRVRTAELAGPGGRIPVHGIASASALGAQGEAACYGRYWVSPDTDRWRVRLEYRRYRRDRGGFAPEDVREFSVPRPPARSR